ncbi:MAG: thiamine pyrophosphate-dependent enzyme [Bacteroidota bacterium]
MNIQPSRHSTPEIFAPEDVIRDYRLIYQSRQASLIGRKEVLSGKAKFGIFGDGKELPQIAMAKVFQPGDNRAGYYRDQTFAFATGISTIQQFFAQLYAHNDIQADPFSGGRQMNAHFASRNLDEAGMWRDQTQILLTTADGSSTASQMPRLVGLAQASKLFRQNPELVNQTRFSKRGREVIFGTIGNASCAEGHFWESINAIGVLQVPAVMSIWDDDYGISVPNEFQITKKSLSDMLVGFRRTDKERGFEIFTVKGWDYRGLMDAYQAAATLAREAHIPSIIHVIELTQPQGHSTSGSHERYKSEERLAWERDHDCLHKFRQWIIDEEIANEADLTEWEKEDLAFVKTAKRAAWQAYQSPIQAERKELLTILRQLSANDSTEGTLGKLNRELANERELSRRLLAETAYASLAVAGAGNPDSTRPLRNWLRAYQADGDKRFGRFLYSQSADSPQLIGETRPRYSDHPEMLSGFELLNRTFDQIFSQNPLVIAFGEDVGQLGDVNQGFAGLQQKYGLSRIMDTGIREASIIGQAIGLAQRGLRPIAEIQYLDYLIYGLQTMSDDLASLHYRTHGGQKAPAIIRTRGHRLEGIWHAGSPLGMMLHALRGVHIAVPRNMTQAAAFYHTFLQGDDPAIVIEVLNAYRLKEALPENLHEITLPLGIPEVIREGNDVSIVTYGACCHIALEAAKQLAGLGIDAEVMDVRTLLPFDVNHLISQSLEKTNRILFLDEDVPGGATAFMMQEVLEKQNGYRWLDSKPHTLSGKAHRPAYGDDGDYWSKPQIGHVVKKVYEIMAEAEPNRFPDIF